MDREVILNKLENLRRCVIRIESKRPETVDSLINDIDRQDIIILNLERAVQVCVDIGAHIIAGEDAVTMPSSMADTFLTLKNLQIIDEKLSERLTKAVGFRNTAVHAYQNINWHIVYSIITECLNDFRTYTKAIMHFVDKG